MQFDMLLKGGHLIDPKNGRRPSDWRLRTVKSLPLIVLPAESAQQILDVGSPTLRRAR